jgi:transposase
MSGSELKRVEVVAEVLARRRTEESAAAMLGLSARQTRRLVRAYRDGGGGALIHKARGKTSNNQLIVGVREYVIELVETRYADFGPTLAAEVLLEKDGVKVSRETLRKWMIADGLWLSRRQRRSFHQPRLRRESYGELIQIDGSDHRWFERRGPACSLLVFIDDATGRLMQLRFVPSESTSSYFECLRGYLDAHGCPVAFYSDKHSVFRINREAQGGAGMTQFGRALAELNIEIICANSSQAKGRVERVNRTLQDRLVKELRLAEVCDMAEGCAHGIDVPFESSGEAGEGSISCGFKPCWQRLQAAFAEYAEEADREICDTADLGRPPVHLCEKILCSRRGFEDEPDDLSWRSAQSGSLRWARSSGPVAAALAKPVPDAVHLSSKAQRLQLTPQPGRTAAAFAQSLIQIACMVIDDGLADTGLRFWIDRSGPELLDCSMIDAELLCEFPIGSCSHKKEFSHLLPTLESSLPVSLLNQKFALAPGCNGSWKGCGFFRPAGRCCLREQPVLRCNRTQQGFTQVAQ